MLIQSIWSYSITNPTTMSSCNNSRIKVKCPLYNCTESDCYGENGGTRSGTLKARIFSGRIILKVRRSMTTKGQKHNSQTRRKSPMSVEVES